MLLNLESQKSFLSFTTKKMQASQDWSVFYYIQLFRAPRPAGVWIRNKAEKKKKTTWYVKQVPFPPMQMDQIP